MGRPGCTSAASRRTTPRTSGHAATYVAFDLLNRAWRSAGHDVVYVQNVTDVDDPLLERAAATGEDWSALAERETELFRADMQALRVLPPDAYVGAVESIPLVVEMVEQLQAAGSVYDVDGDLYFSVTRDPAFGEVSRWSREEMLRVYADRGGDPERPGKKDPLDCLLWQAERPGEPAWDSSLGRGRPGWHVECSAIARAHLGTPVDVQGGGSDLVFPHHEMSASEAQVADPGKRFAQAYVHAGMVGLDGEKMSKSKGNLVLVSKLRESGLDPMILRLVLLGHHYRGDWQWDEADVSAAGARLDKWRGAVGRPPVPPRPRRHRRADRPGHGPRRPVRAPARSTTGRTPPTSATTPSRVPARSSGGWSTPPSAFALRVTPRPGCAA